MATEMAALIVRLNKILSLERRQGYADSAVIGGLEGFIERLARELAGAHPHKKMLAEELIARAAKYAQLSPAKRREAIQALEDVLRALEADMVVGQSNFQTCKPADLLTAPVRYAKGVGPKRERLLNKLGIETIEDLLTYFPRRIEDRSIIKKIAQLRHGERVTIKGRVRAIDVIKPRGDMEILKVAIQDNTGVAYGVWFNQPWLKTQFVKGERISVYGEVDKSYSQVQLNNPVWEPAEKDFLTGRLVPIYSLTEGLPQGALLRVISENLTIHREAIKELVPEETKTTHELLPRAAAFEKIHFPHSLEEFEQARRTLAFEELFLFQIGVAQERLKAQAQMGHKLEIKDELLQEFLNGLPFELTAAQKKALAEIRKDMASERPMHRLLQGDVGSGKTVVATIACLIAIASGYQAAFMAPTEILAQQHYHRISEMLKDRCSVALLVGSLPEKEKQEIRECVKRGEIDLVIGTHALIQDEVRFAKLGFVVIDEQHRFGVIQRAELEKKGENIDILVMSATPIPRTITLTLYGQFDISILDELPHEKHVQTYWVSENKREEVYRLVAEELKKGCHEAFVAPGAADHGEGGTKASQAYVVFPLVEESEELDLKAATETKEELAKSFFKSFNVGLLHGRMNEQEKQQVMAKLRNKEIDVLVSTTIIEVGIDVPDASIMIIEHADRFGLSQLHQLRGRIGRAGQKAYCFAVADAKTEEARRRLEAFRDVNDGFRIAEEDLKLRGPGEVMGLSQHGLDTTFKVADLIRDLELMKAARDEAFKLIQEQPNHPLLEEFKRRFGEKFELARF